MPGKSIWLPVCAVVLAWPISWLLSEVLSAGQDGPGSVLADQVGIWVMLVIWLIASLILAMRSRGRFATFEARAKFAIVGSVLCVPLFLVYGAATQQSYSLRVVNDSGADIESIVVAFDGRRFSHSSMRDGIYAVRHYLQSPPDGLVDISWTDSGGKEHSKTLDVSEQIPRRYDNGMLTIRFVGDDDVTTGFFVDKFR